MAEVDRTATPEIVAAIQALGSKPRPRAEDAPEPEPENQGFCSPLVLSKPAFGSAE